MHKIQVGKIYQMIKLESSEYNFSDLYPLRIKYIKLPG